MTQISIDLMPDIVISGPGVDGACGPAEMLPRMQNQCFRCSSPSLLLFFFPNIRDCFLRKKESLPLKSPSFVCRPLFPVRIVWVLRSSETSLWKFGSAPCERLAIPTQSNLPSSSPLLLFFFFACFLIIGSAEALPILCVRYFRWERERERYRERERERERERDGSDVTIVALKLAMNTLSLAAQWTDPRIAGRHFEPV